MRTSAPRARTVFFLDYPSPSLLLLATYILFSQRAATWRRQRGWLMVYRPSFFCSFFFLFFIPELISAVTYPIAELFLPTHVSWPRVVNVLLEFRLSFLIISQGAKYRKKMHFFTCFSLGDFTFSITAQKRFGLLKNRKRMIHLRWFTFHTVHHWLLWC